MKTICPKCKAIFDITPSSWGMEVACKGCGELFTVRLDGSIHPNTSKENDSSKTLELMGELNHLRIEAFEKESKWKERERQYRKSE